MLYSSVRFRSPALPNPAKLETKDLKTAAFSPKFSPNQEMTAARLQSEAYILLCFLPLLGAGEGT